MTTKSTTQMTKAELIGTLRKKDNIIADLNAKIDELEGLAITRCRQQSFTHTYEPTYQSVRRKIK